MKRCHLPGDRLIALAMSAKQCRNVGRHFVGGGRNNLVVAAAAALVEALIDDPMLAKSPAAELSMSGTAIM